MTHHSGVPGAAERAARRSTVLEVIYLIFNEGYPATSRHSTARIDEAHQEFQRAASLARNRRERELLWRRAAASARSWPSPNGPGEPNVPGDAPDR